MKENKWKNRFVAIIFGILGIVAVLLIWYLAVEFTDLGKVMAGPGEAFSLMVRYMGEAVGKETLIGHIWASLRRVFIGYLLSALAGTILGLMMGYSKTVRAIAIPLFNIVRPIPGVAWIPMTILWFGIGEIAKIFIIFMGGFANVVVNSSNGVKVVDPMYIGAARVLGAGKRQVFFRVIVPASLPYIFAGLQISLSSSWMSVLAAEMVSSQEGVGWLIISGMNAANTAQILAGMIPIGVVGLILITLMRLLERRVLAWNIRGK